MVWLEQEQALHPVHCIIVLMDKDTCPRPEKHPGLQVRNHNNPETQQWSPSVLCSMCFCVEQMDLMTSLRALNKTVEASQVTSDLGGTFTYSHTDWLQFHRVIKAHRLYL